jgi:hypothetical protein
VEKEAMRRYVKTTGDDNIVAQATSVVADVFFALFKLSVFLDKILVVFSKRL